MIENRVTKVLHISTDVQLGGAGIAAYRLHKGLRSLDVESIMLVSKQQQNDEYIDYPTNNYDKVLARLAPRLERIPKHFSNLSQDLVSPAWVPDRLRSRINKHTPDILNLHWVNHGFMRIETLPRLKQPVVWTLHDMWPFSGGEHYVGDSISIWKDITPIIDQLVKKDWTLTDGSGRGRRSHGRA